MCFEITLFYLIVLVCLNVFSSFLHLKIGERFLYFGGVQVKLNLIFLKIFGDIFFGFV